MMAAVLVTDVVPCPSRGDNGDSPNVAAFQERNKYVILHEFCAGLKSLKDDSELFVQIRAIAGGLPPVVTAFDGYKSVELVDGIYQSVKTGQLINLAD